MTEPRPGAPVTNETAERTAKPASRSPGAGGGRAGRALELPGGGGDAAELAPGSAAARRESAEPGPELPGAGSEAAQGITELGSGWPGWVPRLVVLLAGAGALAVQAPGGINVGVLLGMAALVVLSAFVPSSPAPAVLIAAVIVVATAQGGDPTRLAVLAEIPLLHLVHVGAAVAAITPVRAIVAPSALRRPALRFLAVQAAVFVLVGALKLLPPDRNPAIVDVAGLLAAAALAVLAIRLLRTRP